MREWLKHIIGEEPKEGRTGFTTQEREWFLEAYGNRCHFPVYDEKWGWGICGASGRVHLHHIEPRGYSTRVSNRNPDVMTNGIILCERHHVAKGVSDYNRFRYGSGNEDIADAIHYDTEWARKNYYKSGKTSFGQMAKKRKELTDKGRVYWNDVYDEALREIAERVTMDHHFNVRPFPSRS